MPTYRGSITPGAGSAIAAQADEVALTPTGDVAATNVQDGIAELDTEKVAKAGDTMTGDLTVPNLITAGNVDGRDVSVDGTALDSHIADTANPHSVTAAQAGACATANNLSDVANAATARTNLDVYSKTETDNQAIAFAIALGG